MAERVNAMHGPFAHAKCRGEKTDCYDMGVRPPIEMPTIVISRVFNVKYLGSESIYAECCCCSHLLHMCHPHPTEIDMGRAELRQTNDSRARQ